MYSFKMSFQLLVEERILVEKKYKYKSGGSDHRLDQVGSSKEEVKCYGPPASRGLHTKALLCPYS